MGMFIIANLVGSTVQISTLPLPVLSTLQAAGLVFNSICATLILGEPFTRWSLWGTLLVSSGAVLIGVFGAIPAPAHNLEELLELLGRRPFVVWMALQAVAVIALAVATELFAHFSSFSQSARFRLGRGLAYGCISGVLSAHSLLIAKSSVELVVRTITDRDNQFVHWQSWMLVLGLVALALSQLYYLHRGLKLVSTSVLYPLVFCVYNIIAILDGLIYFKQTDQITPLHACLITLGTVILLAGVLALSWRLSDEQHPPAVGQSTLAPGLGLVEDTDGEEEEEEVLLGSDMLAEEGRSEQQPYKYQTFSDEAPASVEAPLLDKSARRKSIAPSVRWTERAEIWDELQDNNAPKSPLPGGLITRRRSTTLPVLGEESALLPVRRDTSATFGPASAGAGPSGDPLARNGRAFRRRRKSTGFPGFTARRNSRKSPTSIQEAVNGLTKLKWWSQKGKDSAQPSTGRTVSPSFPWFRSVSGQASLEAATSSAGADGGSAGRRRDEDESLV
jgi:magnesium transporter